MNRERDTMGIVRSWFRDDGYDDADRVLDAVLAALDTTPQRQRRWLVGFGSMRANWLRYGLAAISLAAVAILGLSLLSHRVASPPTQTPAPTPVASPPPRLSGFDVFGGRYTLAGAYGITVEAPARRWAGYCCPGDPVLFNGKDVPRFASFRYADATLMTLYLDPCQWSQSDTLHPKGAVAIAAAMSGLPGRSGTEPETVIVGGRPAVHVRLTVPDLEAPGNTPFIACYGHVYRSWGLGSGDPRDQEGPRQVDDVYLIDIGEATVLLDASYFPETPKADRRALDAMLQSIQIK